MIVNICKIKMYIIPADWISRV